MDAPRLIERLRGAPDALRALLSGIRDDDARWRPSGGDWSILEIVNHLGDEDAEDFRARIASTLADPSAPWPMLDFDRISERRGYNERDMAGSLDRFARERVESVAFLLGPCAGADWSRAYTHPKIGPISAGTLLASWAAHDALHMRQIAKRLFQLAERDAPPGGVGYAGEWKA